MGGNTSHSDASKLMKTTKILFSHRKKHDEVEMNTKHQVVLVMREMFLKGFICRHFGVYDYNCRKQLMSSCAFPWCWR